MSRDVNQEMAELLAGRDVVNRHSFFQMKYFIINKEPTHQAKLWRCMREMFSRREAIEAMQMELDDCQDNLGLTDIEIERQNRTNIEGDPLNTKEVELKIRKLERKRKAIQATVASLEKKLVETQEEAAFFLEAFRSLEKVEPLKPYDDLESQKQYWNEKIRQEFQLRTLIGQPADIDLAKTTMCLMDDMPVKQDFVKAIGAKRKQLNEQQNIESR